MTYWLMWRLSKATKARYRLDDGFIVHAVADNTDRSLCGVLCNDSGWGKVGDEGEPGCIRCRNALRKLGVLSAKTNE